MKVVAGLKKTRRTRAGVARGRGELPPALTEKESLSVAHGVSQRRLDRLDTQSTAAR